MRAFELPKMTFSNTKRTSLGTCRKLKSLLNRFGQQAKKKKKIMTLLCRQDDNGIPSGFGSDKKRSHLSCEEGIFPNKINMAA